jgi:MoaA/NifB/PqqE/SkfB family radical SAM enzyme
VRPGEALRLARFFGALAVKERLAPRLHVRPLVAELFLTENCNLRCVSCNCWRETTRGELSTGEWKDVIAQLAELRMHKLNFTGGEPLIRPDAVELIRFARDRGIRHLHLNTNGIRLTPAVRGELLEAGVRSFNVSVDGPNALVHDRIRGRLGAFHTTVEHLRGLLAERQRHKLKVRMNFTVMRDNLRSLPGIAALAQELDVSLYLNLATDRTFLFRAEEVAGQAAVPLDALDEVMGELEAILRADRRRLPRYSDLRYIRGHFTDLVQRDLPCAESQLKLLIHARGEIGGCWGHDPAFSVRERRVAEVIDSAHYRAQHARLFRKDCVGCGSNYSLNLRWRPSSYLADALWLAGARRLGPERPAG